MTTPGWKEPTGWAETIEIGPIEELITAGRRVRHQLCRIPAFHLGHTAALMTVQGLPIQQLFSGLLRKVSSGSTLLVHAFEPGPWIYLAGTAPPPWAVEPAITDLVLAKLHSTPPPEVLEQVLAALVEKILAKGT